MQQRSIGIIGAGICGLTAAHDLLKTGAQVTLFETQDHPGGLASGFRAEGWSWPLERFYHHIFTSDKAILQLARELGVGDDWFFPRPITAMWFGDRAYPFDSVLRFLQFPHLSWPAKIRMGVVLAYLRYTRNWRRLERVRADAWLSKMMGEEAYNLLWRPLLVGKMGPYYQDVNLAWFWARIAKRSPALGYFRGGFQGFVDVLTQRVEALGGVLRTSQPVTEIGRSNDGRLRVVSNGETFTFDQVLATVAPNVFDKLCGDLSAAYRQKLESLTSMGAVVIVLALSRQMTPDAYWINLPKSSGFPFLAFVEHTNYIGAEHYGGDRIVYLGDYLEEGHPYFEMDDQALLDHFLPALTRFNPAFDPSWVRRFWVFRERYAQPVPPVNYSRQIPDLKTPVPGLYFASMSQVYPWDRGTNYAVEIGRRVAGQMAEAS